MSTETRSNSERACNNESSRCSKMAEGQDSAKKINLTVKTPKEKQTIEVEENASIKDVCIVFVCVILNYMDVLYVVTL